MGRQGFKSEHTSSFQFLQTPLSIITPRRLDGAVWGMKPDSITKVFLRALAWARKVYEQECEEKKENPDLAYLVDLTFHDLWHEATSRFFEKGLNPMQVAAITGHKTLQMLKRYTQLKA